jgi:hypothetical protein
MRIQPVMGSDEDGVRPRPRRMVMAVLAAMGLVIAALAKGPASAAVVAGVLVAACVVVRSPRAVVQGWVVLALAVAGGVVWGVGRKFLAANDDPGAIRQGAGAFVWSAPVRDVLLLAPVAFVSALPASLALLFVFGKAAHREAAASGSAATRRAFGAASILAWGWVLSVFIMTSAGVGNARYAMPAAFIFPMLCAWVVRGVWGVHASFDEMRRTLARRFTFNNPAGWPAVLTVAAVLGMMAQSRRPDPHGPVRAGAEIAAMVGGGQAWADDLVEARPDVLLYCTRPRGAGMATPRVLWRKADMLAGRLPPKGEFVLLRTDAGSDEARRYRGAIEGGALEMVGDARVGAYTFVVCRAR